MAGDWIKMRTDLYRDPKICMMADYLLSSDSELALYVNQNTQRDMVVTRNVMRNVTVGALVSVWGVLRHRGKRSDDDLIIKGCAIEVIDDLSDIPGFGNAMSSVGWVVEAEEGLVFPRFFEEFNVDPDEEIKQKNAERQRRWREKQREENNVLGNVTVASQNNAREEKRREDIKNTPLPPASGGIGWVLPDWIPKPLWQEFAEVRRKRKKPLTDRAKQLAVSKLEALRDGGHDPQAVIEQTILHAWDTFYPIKSDGDGGSKGGTDQYGIPL